MRVVTYIDGQNLYHLAREAWGTDGGFLDTPYNPINKSLYDTCLEPDRYQPRL